MDISSHINRIKLNPMFPPGGQAVPILNGRQDRYLVGEMVDFSPSQEVTEVEIENGKIIYVAAPVAFGQGSSLMVGLREISVTIQRDGPTGVSLQAEAYDASAPIEEWPVVDRFTFEWGDPDHTVTVSDTGGNVGGGYLDYGAPGLYYLSGYVTFTDRLKWPVLPAFNEFYWQYNLEL